jgi:hypothetical protein
MIIKNKIEFASELADKMLRSSHNDIEIDIFEDDVCYYTEEAQKYFDIYYDIVLNHIEENEQEQ